MQDEREQYVNYYEDEKGPFMIRVSGSNDFVSKIKTLLQGGRIIHRIEFNDCGWDNPEQVMSFDTLEEALKTCDKVFLVDGQHYSIESIR